ncbi:MAG: Arc family DNA-binding protein [Bacteroidota bacterium]
MPSLTLKGIPDEVLSKLRRRAEQERRSLNQQAIWILEQGVAEPRPSFMELHKAFVEKHGPSPFDDESYAEVFENLRDQDPGPPSPFEDEA